MPLPECYLPREGDEVLIRARVKSATKTDDDCYMEVVGQEHKKLFMKPSEIHSLHCRHWNEGDRVTSIEFSGPGRVLATSDEWVWVMCETGQDEGGRYTLTANELEPYVEPLETMTEAQLLAGLEGLMPPGSQSVVVDDDEIKSS